jgi:DNA-binding Lrp family transcriptional regulator
MQTGIVELPSYFKGIGEIEKQFDKTNIKILTAMWKYGPRNLLEVSRRTGLPFTSVYHRVAKLEAKSGRIVYLLPETSKLGLVRVIVLITTKPGLDEIVRTALKIPNLWRVINKCEGSFTHFSTHAVPIRMVNDFKEYVQTLVGVGLITDFKLILTGDSVGTFPNFDYYNPDLKQWTFPWQDWVSQIKEAEPNSTLADPKDYNIDTPIDKKDVLIIAELEDDGRRRFSEMTRGEVARDMGLVESSLQVIKYHWDKRLKPAGFVNPKCFVYDVYPYPVEVSSYHEVMLEFTSNLAMNKFLSIAPDLLFLLSFEKVLKRNAVFVLTYISNSQLSNMFSFFSELIAKGIMTSYSTVRLDFASRETEGIPFRTFDEQKGWAADFPKCRKELLSLLSQSTVSARLSKVNRAEGMSEFSSNLSAFGSDSEDGKE